jgi:hypothetical protein
MPNRILRPVLRANWKLWLIWGVESSATQLAQFGGVMWIMSISLEARWKTSRMYALHFPHRLVMEPYS